MNYRYWSLVIHGPIDNCCEIVNRNIELAKANGFEEIILATYLDSKDIVVQKIHNDIELVFSKDVVNPGFCNINRQMNLVIKGIQKSTKNCIIKLRTDQTINFSKFSDVLENFEKSAQFNDGFLTTNCYTRKDRPYHPSDMFMAGKKENIHLYFSSPQFDLNDWETRLIFKNNLSEMDSFQQSSYWPESYFFRNFLNAKHEVIQNTWDHSRAMLKKYVFMVNSYKIDLRWIKFENGEKVIQPYFLYAFAPFEGGPRENASCFYASELKGKIDSRELRHMCSDRLYWFLHQARILVKLFLPRIYYKVRHGIIWQRHPILRAILRPPFKFAKASIKFISKKSLT